MGLKYLRLPVALFLFVAFIHPPAYASAKKKRPRLPAVVTAPDAASTLVNNPVALAVLMNDGLVDGSAKISSVSKPKHGKVKIVGGTVLLYTPKAAYSGGDSFSYKVTQDRKKSTGTVFISVSPAVAAPSVPSLALVQGVAANLTGDLNGDCIVNNSDLTLVASNWGKKSKNGNLPGDANKDGLVNGQDIALIASNFGHSCPVIAPDPFPSTPTPTPSATPTATPTAAPDTPVPTLPPTQAPTLPPTPWPDTPTPPTSGNDEIQTMTAPVVLNTAGQTYRLTKSMRFPGTGFYIAAPNVTIDLNGHTIYYGRNGSTSSGVILYLGWINTEINIASAAEAKNAIVKNGSIVHEGSADYSHGISGGRGEDSVISGMRIKVNGKDSAPIFFNYGATTVKNNVLVATATDTNNRHSGPGNVWVPNGKAIADHNVLIGGNSGFFVDDGSIITNNVISNAGFATDGYAVFTYHNNAERLNGIIVTDNIIIPSRGRGVLLNRFNNCVINNNIILSLEGPNSEFGRNLNAPAIRLRYTSYNNSITGNTTLGIGAAEGHSSNLTSASGLYLTNSGTNGAGGFGSNTYANNNMTTIYIGAASPNGYAQPITLEGNGSNDNDGTPVGSTDSIVNNVCNSNLYQVRTNGYDGSSMQLTPLVGNSFNWITGSTAAANFISAAQTKLAQIGMSNNADAVNLLATIASNIHRYIDGVPLNSARTFWFTQYYTPDLGGEKATLLDSTFGSGVDPRTYTQQNFYEGFVNDCWGQTVQVKLTNSSGVALANTAVTLTTDKGDTYSYPTLKTNASGFVGLPIITTCVDKQTAATAPITVANRGTSTIIAGGLRATLANSSITSQASIPLR